MSWDGPERRRHFDIPEELIEHIAERAAEKAIEKVSAEVGRGVMKKLSWILGATAVALFFWLAGKGLVKP